MADPQNVLALDDLRHHHRLRDQAGHLDEGRHRRGDRGVLQGRRARRATTTFIGTEDLDDDELDALDRRHVRRADRQARQLHHHTRRSPTAPPTSTSSRRRTTCASGSASTACCTRSCAARSPPSSRSSAASRSWPTWTSPSRASRRTATARSRSAGTSSTSASRRCPPSTASASSCVSCARTRSCCTSSDLGFLPTSLERFEASFTQAVRRHPRHRPDRFGQVDVALRGDQRAQRSRPPHHHRRGPGRVPASRRQPVPDQHARRA